MGQVIKHDDIFSDIYGRATEKAILKSALHASKPVHILLNGPPGNNKTGFLRAIEKKYNTALFLNFTSASGPGTMTDIFQRRPKILLIDEIEKAPKNVRAVLLDLMENGRITYTLKKEKIDVTDLNITVIATCNHIDKLAPEFLDRMQVVNVKPYDFEEYVRVAVFRLRQEGISADLADYMYTRLT